MILYDSKSMIVNFILKMPSFSFLGNGRSIIQVPTGCADFSYLFDDGNHYGE